MLNEAKMKLARHNFTLASEEFHFQFESPFALTDEIEAFGYIPNYGSRNGVVICLSAPPDFSTDHQVVTFCKEMDCLYSCLNIDSFTGEYRRAYFRKLLRDWGKFEPL